MHDSREKRGRIRNRYRNKRGILRKEVEINIGGRENNQKDIRYEKCYNNS